MFADELGHSVWIRRRPDEVFAFLLHARNYVRWQAGVLDSWHSPRGRVAVGTRIHQVRDLLGQQVAGMLEIVERAPTRSAVCGVVSPLELTASYDLASEAGGTRLRANGRVPGSQAWCWLRPVAQRELAASCRQLKSVLEREDLGGFVTVPGRSDGRGGP
jgi:hypothetical protein